MWQRKPKIIVVLAVFNLSISLKAQKNISVEFNPGVTTACDQHKQNVLKYSPLLANNTTVGVRDVRFAIRIMRQPLKDFYRVQASPGFFCRQVLKLQRITTLHLFLRLGSLEYVDWMEGKQTLNMPLNPKAVGTTD